MRKAVLDDFIITTKPRELKVGLFVEQPKPVWTAMNKWTGDELGEFQSFDEAIEAVRNHCK